MRFLHFIYFFVSFYLLFNVACGTIYTNKDDAIAGCTKAHDRLRGYFWCTGYGASPFRNREEEGFNYCVEEIIDLNGDVTYICAKYMPSPDGPIHSFNPREWLDDSSSSLSSDYY